MRKIISKATKAASKSSKGVKAKKGPGRGGARTGAGRKPKFGETQQISIDVPADIIDAMNMAGIKNKTAYIVYIIAVDLIANNAILNKTLKKITEDLQGQYY